MQQQTRHFINKLGLFTQSPRASMGSAVWAPGVPEQQAQRRDPRVMRRAVPQPAQGQHRDRDRSACPCRDPRAGPMLRLGGSLNQ